MDEIDIALDAAQKHLDALRFAYKLRAEGDEEKICNLAETLALATKRIDTNICKKFEME